MVFIDALDTASERNRIEVNYGDKVPDTCMHTRHSGLRASDHDSCFACVHVRASPMCLAVEQAHIVAIARDQRANGSGKSAFRRKHAASDTRAPTAPI